MEPRAEALRMAEVVRRTKMGESAAAIALLIGRDERTVVRMRGEAMAAGKLPRRTASLALPGQTKACAWCGAQYGPRKKSRSEHGGHDWSGWRKSKCCSVKCRLRHLWATRPQTRRIPPARGAA